MSLVDTYHQEHKARLARMMPKPKPKLVVVKIEDKTPVAVAIQVTEIKPQPQAEEKPVKKTRVMIKTIKEEVAAFYGFTVLELESHRRHVKPTFARQVAMYLSSIMTHKSMPDIGTYFGGRDHTTVLHGRNKIAQLVETDPATAEAITKIKDHIMRATAEALLQQEAT